MAKTPSKSTAASGETKLVKDLAKILNDAELGEIEYEKGSLKIRVARQSSAAPAAVVAAPVAAPVAAAPTPAPIASSAPAVAPADDHKNATKSPMVGTAYIRPSPEAEPFFKPGDMVKSGATVLLIEAMKTFNPITAEKTGKLVSILVEDAQPLNLANLCL